MGKYLGVDGLKALLLKLDSKFVKKDEYLNLQPNIILSATSELDIQVGSFIIISKPTNHCIIKSIMDVPGINSPIYIQLRTNEDFTIQYTPNIKWSSPLSLQMDKCYLIELHKNYVEDGWLGRCMELTLVEEQEIIETTKEVWGRIDKFELKISGVDGWEKYNDKYIVYRGAPSVEALVDAVVDYKVTRGEEVERYSNSGSHEIVSNVDWIEIGGDKVTILDYSKDKDGQLTCKLYDEDGKYIISEQIHIINSSTEFTFDYRLFPVGYYHSINTDINVVINSYYRDEYVQWGIEKLVFRNETVDLIEAVENGLCLVNTGDFEWSNQIYMSSVSSFVFRGLHEGDYELHLVQLTKPVVGGDWVQDNRLVIKIHIR